MKHLQLIISIFVITVFLLGIYVYSTGKLDELFTISTKEGLSMSDRAENNEATKNCPDLLIKHGNELLLYNSRIPLSKGINPLTFSNLDEYVVFVRNERKKGNNCPVLFLQQESDLQGRDVFRARPNPFDLQPGLQTQSAVQIARTPAPVIDSNIDHPPYNKGQYTGFDPLGLSVGVYTTLDQIHDSTSNQVISDNPMDPNWGGVLHTQKQIESGKYDENTVYKPNLLTVRNTQFNPGQFGHESPPNQLITFPH